MGNRSSTVQPAGPPPLLTAAVMGDLAKFKESWTGEESLKVQDRQENNVLHALFSCRGRPDAKCVEILDQIHSAASREKVLDAYQAKNNLGCLPIWILVAYGNVPLLKHVQTKFADQQKTLADMLQVPNHQGDSPFLATCSQGNTEMVRFLKEEVMTSEQFTKAFSQANQKGTTPLQIVIANNHRELLQFLFQSDAAALQDQLLQKNAAGLSSFHVCAERNNHEMLKTLLDYMMMETNNNSKDDNSKEALEKVISIKDKNDANVLHVASFCGNLETVTVLIEVIQKAYGDKAVDVLDKMDSQARTAYWLSMVQGKDAVGKLLADAGVDTKHPNMCKEIEEAKKKREERAASRPRTVDGPAFLGR